MNQKLSNPATSAVDAFVNQVRTPSLEGAGGGRLIFAIDATASRQPTWDTACQLQVDMFQEAAAIGGLEVQLVYYRGSGECRASRWVSQPYHLAGLMERIHCRMGQTQIVRILEHARREAERTKVAALVFIGDANEDLLDEVAREAAALGRAGVPAFVFQEGSDEQVEQVFREIAMLTHGAYGRFDTGAAAQLRELLRAVAAFAAGGLKALASRSDTTTQKLLAQLKR
ncbi:MAG TPA: VWA domain-containing protein [Bradyrhizobium sp.]|jgi:hypothetical protein|nr:VWA domain-containing protein [Bradyrhizobium sp.]